MYRRLSLLAIFLSSSTVFSQPASTSTTIPTSTTTSLTATSTAATSTTANRSERVVVSANRLEEELPRNLAEYGTHVDIIENEAIKQGGYVDVAGAVNALAPSLFVSSKNGPFDYVDVSLLGSRTEDVLWLVDGVRINNRLYASTTPLDTMPAGIVERLEVLEGGQALFYGTQAIAGAINIVTKSFSNKADGNVTFGIDTNSGRHFDGYYRDAIERNQFVAYASVDKSDGYRAFRKDDYQPSVGSRDRGYDVVTLGGKYAFTATEALRLIATYQRTDADVDSALPFRVEKNVNSRKEQIATAKIDFDAGNDLALFLKTYYHSWDTHYDTRYNDLGTPRQVDVLYDNAYWGYKDYGLNALAKFKFDDRVEYYAGYDMQKYGGRDDVLVIRQRDEGINALFGQIHTTDALLPNTKLAAGVRYNKPTVGESATIWNVSGQHNFTDRLFARTTFGTNFRSPTAEELFADDPIDERGNPNLKPEKSASINASLGGQVPLASTGAAKEIVWEITGFMRRITNLIDLATYDDNTQQDVFGNIDGTVRVHGAEISLQAPLTDTWSGNFSYTFNQSKDPDIHQQILRVPENLLKAMLAYTALNNRYGAELVLQHTGAIYASVGGERVNYGNYTVVNLSNHVFFDEAQHHRINLSLENVFSKEYGRPSRGCTDVASDGPNDCSAPYTYTNRGVPRTLRATYAYAF